MRLFDTHAHLNFPDYETDHREVWERAKKNGLVGLISVGTDVATSKRAIELAHELDLFASVGIHPNDAKQFAGDDWKRSIEEIVQDEKVVAIGETGFDLYRRFTSIDEQAVLLDYFLDLAEKLEKPVLFHCREAYEELLKVLKGRKGEKGIRGVVHAFGPSTSAQGRPEQSRGADGDGSVAQKFLDLGLHLSLTAQVTYPKNQEFYGKLIPAIPLDRMLLETDCPFLPPEGLRGQRNEPRHVDIVAETIGRFIGRRPEVVAEQTTENALRLFGLER